MQIIEFSITKKFVPHYKVTQTLSTSVTWFKWFITICNGVKARSEAHISSWRSSCWICK